MPLKNIVLLTGLVGVLATPVSGQAPNAGDKCAPTWVAYVTNSATNRTRELASACTDPEVMRAASAIGMARYDPPTIKDVITAQWVMEGTLVPPGVSANAPLNVSRVTLGISYVVPGIRLAFEGTGSDGRPLKGIAVASGRYAWDETAPGVGATVADASAIDQRLPLIWLTPFGAVWAAIDGVPGQLKVTTSGGKTVIASRIDDFQVTATLGADHRPETVEVRGKQGIYVARYAEYQPDAYGVMTPKTMEWTLNGRPFANLKVTQFRGNPYVIFPVPASVRGGAPR